MGHGAHKGRFEARYKGSLVSIEIKSFVSANDFYLTMFIATYYLQRNTHLLIYGCLLDKLTFKFLSYNIREIVSMCPECMILACIAYRFCSG